MGEGDKHGGTKWGYLAQAACTALPLPRCFALKGLRTMRLLWQLPVTVQNAVSQNAFETLLWPYLWNRDRDLVCVSKVHNWLPCQPPVVVRNAFWTFYWPFFSNLKSRCWVLFCCDNDSIEFKHPWDIKPAVACFSCVKLNLRDVWKEVSLICFVHSPAGEDRWKCDRSKQLVSMFAQSASSAHISPDLGVSVLRVEENL